MSTPAERAWVVDAFLVQDRGDGFADYIPDPNAVLVAMGELQAILQRVGGVATVTAARREISEGRVETLAFVFRWRSFAPVDTPEPEQGIAAGPPAPAAPEPSVAGSAPPARETQMATVEAPAGAPPASANGDGSS
jgi:hypothetical protein